MEYRKVPKTGLEVSSICLGTMTFGTPVGREDSVRLVHYALERGINFIDTANIYEGYARKLGSAGGVAEECLGEALKGRRQDAIVATKVGMSVGDGPLYEGLGAAAIEHNLTKSLKRLDNDYVDIYYAHRYDEKTAPEELAGAMNEQIKKGRIRHWAVSNYSGLQIAQLLKACDENGLTRPVMCQPALSLLNVDAIADIMYVCAREQVALVPYRVLQSGLLTGKYKQGQQAPQGSRKQEQPGWMPDMTKKEAQALESIREVCSTIGTSMTRYALDFVLRQAGVVSAIVGVKYKEQIDMAVDGM